MPSHLTNETLNQIQAAVDRGEKILAIKLHREATGAGLAESKAFVESLRPGAGTGGAMAGMAPPAPDKLDAELTRSLYGRNLIAAIRRHRAMNPGMGLAQAKQEVEALSMRLQALHPEQFTKASPSGCRAQAIVIMAAIVVALVAAVAFFMKQ